VGMDTPQLTPELLAPAFAADAWQGCDAWFGPAVDGGFWALGLARPRSPELLLGVPMSTPSTGTVQRSRLTAAGLRVRDLPTLRDVDTWRDAAAVARLAPGTAFARGLRELTARELAAGELAGRRTALPGSSVREPAGSAAHVDPGVPW